jgi:hypothetical protein
LQHGISKTDPASFGVDGATAGSHFQEADYGGRQKAGASLIAARYGLPFVTKGVFSRWPREQKSALFRGRLKGKPIPKDA